MHGHAGQAGGLSGQGSWATGIWRGSEHSQQQARNLESSQAQCKLLGYYKQPQSHSDYPGQLTYWQAAEPGVTVPIGGALPLVLEATALEFTWRLAAALRLSGLTSATAESESR